MDKRSSDNASQGRRSAASNRSSGSQRSSPSSPRRNNIEPIVIDTSKPLGSTDTTQASPLMNKYKDTRRIRSTSKGKNFLM